MTHITCSPLSTASYPRVLRNQSKHNFKVPYCQTAVYFNSFYPSSVRQWNSLPENIKSSLSISLLKHYLNSEYK